MKVWANVSPGIILSLLNSWLDVDAIKCTLEVSLFIQTTVSPALIVIETGLICLFNIVTVWPCAPARVVVVELLPEARVVVEASDVVVAIVVVVVVGIFGVPVSVTSIFSVLASLSVPYMTLLNLAVSSSLVVVVVDDVLDVETGLLDEVVVNRVVDEVDGADDRLDDEFDENIPAIDLPAKTLVHPVITLTNKNIAITKAIAALISFFISSCPEYSYL